MNFILFFVITIVAFLLEGGSTDSGSDDYYNLLGVQRDANLKEIRKAFKTLAVKLHPDKNKDDKDADAKFVKIARAYEVLKDPDSRRDYDLYGSDKEESKANKYHSYTYYRDQFGIYDDDPLIVTLSQADYELNVLDDNQAWFVNFYSPHCHHCHELAPIWRRLATEMEGVVRIAAVNCDDDWQLCQQLKIEAYPTLMYYEKETHLHEGEIHRGSRSFESLEKFVLSKINTEIEVIGPEKWDRDYKKRNCLIFLCTIDASCPEEKNIKKIAAIMEELLPVVMVSDESLASRIHEAHKTSPVVFWKGADDEPSVNAVAGLDAKEILENVLKLLPNPETIDERKFQEIRSELRVNKTRPWLICFYIGPDTELNLSLKRLPTIVPNINIGLIHCGRSSTLCKALHVPRYPAWGTLKEGGAFEMHHGRDVLTEVAAFARDSLHSSNLHALSPADFQRIVQEGGLWFIDWFAPWCPPCKRLLPELRKASRQFDPDTVRFGTVDCTLHSGTCQQEGVRSYPTTRLYNGSQVHHFYGTLSKEGIVEFIGDTLNPLVSFLDEKSFINLEQKPASELWAVDYFAPWCMPCQKLAGEWRKLAKQLSKLENVKIASVNCVTSSALCESQNIRAYPTIRLYPVGSKGLTTTAIYRGNTDVVSLKKWILGFVPSEIESLTSTGFRENVFAWQYDKPWLIDFFAPWCGHCVHFEPEFRLIAKALSNKVKAAKIDCEMERHFCGSVGVHQYPTLRLYLSRNVMYDIAIKDNESIVKKISALVANHRTGSHDEL